MTDTHGQGETFDPGLPEWERELIEQQQHDRGERRLIRSRWPKPVGRDTVDLAEAMDAQDQGERRDRQIQAAIGALECAGIVDPAPLAAELVDAVNAAGAQTQDLGDGYHEADLRAGVWLWLDAAGIRVMPDRTVTLRWKALDDATAEAARGYAQAVANLRDVAGYDRWVERTPEYDGRRVWSLASRHGLADYLEAVGPWAAQSAADGPTHPDLPDERRTGGSGTQGAADEADQSTCK